ncbi:MAG TPA: catalase family protein [Terriglobales bacterium]
MNTRRTRIIIGLIVVAALGYYFFLRSKPLGPMGEVVSHDEDYLTAQIVASALSMVNASHQTMAAKPLPGNPPGTPATANPTATAANAVQPYRRDVHAKTYGCVKATFRVLENLDPKYQQGIFATPGQYDAWIRYSSGSTLVQRDGVDDARGMAIKLMGVPGKKLMEDDGVPHAETQDFVMMNATQFFILNLPEYLVFTQYLGAGSNYGYFLGGFTPDLPEKNWRRLFYLGEYHPREMMLALKTLKPPPDSLLNTQFYSVSAYNLGAQSIVKYSARPCGDAKAADVNRSQPNFLRDEMTAHLKDRDACFEFMVQPQVPGKNMPVEDTTVEWSESDSPFVPVARIEIKKQTFVENQETCENLSYNPWHSLPAHKPLGVMNRVRRPLYLEVARYRRSMNGAPLCEPKNWNERDESSCETVENSIVTPGVSSNSNPQGKPSLNH